MAMADVAASSPERPSKRRPFSNWVKKITSLNHSNNGKKAGVPKSGGKKKNANGTNGNVKNNPYPESGQVNAQRRSFDSDTNGSLATSTAISRRHNGRLSFESSPSTTQHEREDGHAHTNRSAAPTVATHAGTINSDAGQSRAPTTATGAGALSSNDGAGAGSTFSSPNHSERSLTTTLTTIQSQSPGIALHQAGQSGQPNNHHHGSLNNPNPVMFSHQYPVSPAPSTVTTMSAIPRHMNESLPNTYTSATANNLLSDNASILTLASSSKRRRRSVDSHTDASVRAIPPSSVWGGSRESLPLSVLSANAESTSSPYTHAPSRPSIGGLASTERASVYSSTGVLAPALASERNSYYATSTKKDPADAKSLRSFTNLDNRSINDTRSMDLNSLKNYEGSVRSGAFGHSRNDSIPGSIGAPLGHSPTVRHANISGNFGRRSGDWQEVEQRGEGEAAK